jgi:hypothetical protein
MAHKGRWLVLAAVFIALQGCSSYPAPPEPLRPTTVGVIASATHDEMGYHTRLVDGRVIDEPQNGIYQLSGGIMDPGFLLLASSDGGGFAVALPPMEDGCWEAWRSPSDSPIVWDMGDSILFTDGIELPKASGFHVDPQSQNVDGRLAWVSGPSQLGMNFCANWSCPGLTDIQYRPNRPGKGVHHGGHGTTETTEKVVPQRVQG